MPSGDGQTNTFQRPINLFYSLEIDGMKRPVNRVPEIEPNIACSTESTRDPLKTQDLPEETQVRPKRAAAIKAMEQISKPDY